MLTRGIARFPTSGEMYRSNRVRSLAVYQAGRGDRLPSCVGEFAQDTIDDAAQNALRKTFSRRIDGRNPPKMDRNFLVVLDYFKLGMIHANSFPAHTRPAKNNNAL